MDKLATLTKQNLSSNVDTHNNYNNNNTNNNNNCKAILLSNTTTTTTKLKNSNLAATATNAISNKSPTLATQTAITKTTTITTTTTLNKQRNKLIRTPLSIGNSGVDGQTSPTLDDVMGGGFTSPPPVQQKQQQQQQQQLQQQQQQMHEKLLQQQELQQKLTKIGNAESKTTACGVSGSGSELKQHLLVDVDAATEHEEDTPPQTPHQLAAAPAAEQKGPNDKKTPTKTHKESKFAAKLRRSFRRAEHKSLEIKHPPASNTTNASSASSAPPQPDNHNFIFSLTNLPGLVAGAGSGCGGHGHINPALLLDSPDESTPPEFNYQALSSVATTNSSTSIESNDFYAGTGDYTTTTNTNASSLLQSTGSSYQQSPQKQQQQQTTTASMGGEVSSTANAKTDSGAPLPPSAARPKLQKQNSSKSDGGFVTLAAAAVASAASTAAASTSRSCSITSESSSAKLTRLQNFLFKSSGDSSRSYLGHSNDGFTASSHNSSSGEWENLTSFGTYNEPPPPPASNTAISGSDGAAGSYYQYTLTSPNNPFLPEIIARSYHSPYDEEEEDEAEAAALQQQLRHAGDELDELDANVTAVKYGAHTMLRQQRSSPAASTTPLQSRASSQEGQQPDGSCSGASTPGRQKRKLFSLASPQAAHYQQQQQQHVLGSSPPSTGMGATVRLLNPFLSASGSPPKSGGIAGESSSSSSFSSHFTRSKNVATSPIAVPQDLNAKREEFLRATMKICLVVSPPSSKLQLKSKSLTHLDGLDSIIAGQHGGTTTKPGLFTQPLPQSHTTPHPFPQASLAPIQPHRYPQRNHHHSHHSHHFTTHQSSHKQRSNNSATRSSRNSTTSNVHATPTIYTPSLRKKHASSQTPPLALSPTSSTIATSSACNKICCCSNTNDIQDVSGAVGNTSPLSASHVVFPPFTTVSSNNTLPHFAVQKASLSLQKDIDLVSSSTVATAAVSSVTSTSAHQHSLSPASGFHSATPTGSSAVNFFHYALGQATTATVMGGSGGTPSSHRKKTTFMQRKKPLLTRSEVSSSEYFSVSFCTENGCQEEEFIPATKGVTLYNALNQALRRRNLSFSQIAITDNNLPSFLEAGTTSYTSSLDENTEVENLAGHHLVVTERDGSRKTLQKAASFGSRTRPPRLLSSASTEETTESGDQRAVPGKQLKQRWSGLFGIKNPQQSQLCELLNNYAKMGVPQRTPAALNFDHPDFDAAQEYLDNMHKSWRDFVHCEEMSDSETRIQTAIWELVTTEVYYIHALQTVTDLFLACLEAVQEEKLLTDVDQHRLFSNVRDICEANLKFWTLHLYPMVAHSVATREPMRIEFFQPGFTTFAATFSPYKKYCAEQSTCQFYCKELNRTNSLFTSYLAWCESQKMCNRLRLADILVRPMQRLTKYSLLLAAIKKHQTDVEDIEAVDNMIHTVENFVCSVNNHLTTRQEHERLKGVMARIESYDVVDTNNELLDKMVKQYSQMFDLCAPMKGCPTHQVRHLFMEGDHKFKDHLGKADVHCFLLTDMLLVCKTIAKKGLGSLKVIRQPYLTDRLMIHHEVKSNTLNCVYLNEFQVAITAFTLQCSEAKNWYESLKRAKLIYTRLKQGGANWDSFRFGGSGASGGTADSLGVKKSPMNSSICSHVTSANNSHSGSVEWNDSRNISVDFEKTNSLSSDEGSMAGSHAAYQSKGKNIATSPHKMKVITSSANTLSVQPVNHLGQSLPNLNLHHNQTNLYHTYSNNTLLVPGTTSSHSGQLLLSPCHRGISYPPPSPTRVPLRRGMAFSTSIKSNPPLVKTRNITSQNSINWHQIPATPTPTSPQMSQHNSPSNNGAALMGNTAAAAATAVTSGGVSPTATAAVKMQSPLTTAPIPLAIDSTNKNLSNHNLTDVAGSGSGGGSGSNCQLQFSNETDV